MKQFDSTIGLMVWEEEECKDSTCPSSLLESRRTWILDGPGDGVKEEGTSIISACESFIKIWHQEPCQDSTCPSSIFLESRRTWTFLMDLEMVSDGRVALVIMVGWWWWVGVASVMTWDMSLSCGWGGGGVGWGGGGVASVRT